MLLLFNKEFTMKDTQEKKTRVNVTKKTKEQKDSMITNKNKDILFIFYSLFVVIFILMFLRLYVLYDNDLAPNVHLNIEQVVKIPINTLIQSLMLFTIAYSGFEGSIAVIKSSRLPVGQYTKLPQYKLNALKVMILLWTILVFYITMLNILIQPKIIIDEKYAYIDLQPLYTSFGTIIVMYIYVREGPKVATDIHIKNKLNDTNCDQNGEENKTPTT